MARVNILEPEKKYNTFSTVRDILPTGKEAGAFRKDWVWK